MIKQTLLCLIVSGLVLTLPMLPWGRVSTAATGRPAPRNPDVQVVHTLPNTTERVSVDSNGQEGNWLSRGPAISADGRYVAFYSLATNLVISDTNDAWDVFVHDRETGATEQVSVDSNGQQGDFSSLYLDLSADGLYLAFHSYATNLVLSDTNDTADIFLHDRWSGVTEMVSLTSDEEQANGFSTSPAVSADGLYVAFRSYATNLGTFGGAYVRDRLLGVTEQVDVNATGEPGNDYTSNLDISADGRYIVFDSYATNLVNGDTNAAKDVFVRDRLLGITERVSIASGGEESNDNSQQPAISDDGRYVIFHSYANNLVSGDTNGTPDVFVRDLNLGITGRISIDSSGQQGNGPSYAGDLSADGRYATFSSSASNLVPDDTNSQADVFVHDQLTRLTYRASVDPAGQEGNGGSGGPTISAEGGYIAFQSDADNLVANDTNGYEDIFVHQWEVQTSFLPVVLKSPTSLRPEHNRQPQFRPG